MKQILSFIKRSKLCSSAVSCLLALSVILSTFAGMSILAGNTDEVWSGEVASGFAKGSGTEKNPYKISNGEELALAVTQNKGYYYEMTNDVYLNDVSSADWKNKVNKEWNVKVLSDESSAFKGVFNGNGYKVFGLFVNKTYTAPTDSNPDKTVAAGLFPTVSEGTQIYGVGIEKAYVSLTNDHTTKDMSYVGYVGMVGYAYNSSSEKIVIDRCYLGEEVTLNGAFIGLVGSSKYTAAKSVEVTNCYALASGNAFNGGTVSNNRFMLCAGLNSNCYKLEYNYSTIGLSNSGYEGITDTKYNYCGNWCSSTVGTKVNVGNMKGSAALTNMPGLNTDGAYEVIDNGYPTLKIFNKKAGDVWDGKTLSAPLGKGSEDEPYLINNAYELAYAVKYPASGATYKLTADIYLNDINKVNWTTGEGINGYKPNSWFSSDDTKTGFSATLIGDGNMVYGLYYKDTETTPKWDAKKTGLIPAVNEGQVAVVSGLGVDYAYMNGPGAVSAVVAYARGNVTVSNSFAGANVTLKGHCAGAIFAINARGLYEIGNCYSLANISTTGNSDSQYGLVGDFYGNVSGSYIKNSYNAKGAISTKGAGSLWANNYATSKTGTGIAVISADKMQGLDVLSDSNKMPKLGNAYLATTEYPILLPFYEGPLPDTYYAWDGVSKTQPTVGSGTSADPFIIESGAELAFAVTDSASGRYYKLARNIYLNDIDKINWSTGEAESGYTPNVWFASGTFGGNLDGDGYSVYGIYYNDSTSEKKWYMAGSALIPSIGEGASVKNIAVDKAYVQHPNGAGGLIAAASGTTYSINSCYVGKDVTLKGYASGAFVAVSSGKFTISNSYSLATTLKGVEDDSSSHYGLFGDAYSKPGTDNVKNSVMANCFNANGPVTTKLMFSAGSVSGVYATAESKGVTVISKTDMQGLDVFSLESKMPELNKGRAFYATETYPVLKIFAEEASGPVSEDIWSGAIAKTFPQGDGSEQNPFVITNGAELALAVTQTNGYYYVLNNDIYLNDVSVANWEKSVNNIEWLGDQTFNGNIDGKGYIVYGIWYAPDTAKTTTGLVNYFNGGSIKNIGVRYAQIYAQKYAGLVGSISGAKSSKDRVIGTSFVDDTVTIGYTLDSNCGAGGIVGIIDSLSSGTNVKVKIENCYSKATITGLSAERLNGIVGTAWKSNYAVKNCYSVGYAPYYGKNDYVISLLIVNGVAPSEVYSGVYATAGTSNVDENYTIFNRGLAYGTEAKTQISVFDYENVWDTVEMGTPKLKIFTSITGKDESPVDSGPVWNGVIATEFESGSGTEADPYIISKGSQLALAVSQAQEYFYKLSEDIYLNDTTKKNWQNGSKLNEWVENEGFVGHLDGDGHCVYGIWYPKNTNKKNAGLIPVMIGGSVKNIGVRSSFVYSTDHAGGIVGNMLTNTKKTVENCFVDETVSVEFTSNGNYGAGGIVGMTNSLTSRTSPVIIIKNCYSKATINAHTNQRMNGIIGSNWKSAYLLENCYSVGTPAIYAANSGTHSSLAVDAEGGPGAMAMSEVYKNVYTNKEFSNLGDIVTVIKEQETLWGSGAKALLKGFDFENVWQTVEKGTPKLKIFADISGEDIEIGSEDPRFDSGIGSKNNPYIIKTAQQLRNLVTATDTKGKFYKLANDIYLNDVSKSNWILKNPEGWYEWESPAFMGTLEGDGHFIYGLYLNKTAGDAFSYVGAGLFPSVNGATIKNVHIRKSYIAGSSTVGAIAGTHRGASTIMACSADETVTLKGYTVGGIVGGGNGGLCLYYSYSTAALTGGEGVTNGLVGDIWNSSQEVVECYTIGYKPYRNGFFPATYAAVYGTEGQSGLKVLTEAQMTGNAAKKNMSEFDWKNVWTVKAGETPHPKVVKEVKFSFTDEGVKGRAWSGKFASKFAGGSGTETDPYLIETPEQLALLIRTTSTAGKFYKLTADIKINDTSKANWTENAKNWLTSGSNFRGTFDGDGHVVSGIFYNVEGADGGLFPTIGYDATIKRVGIINSSMVSKDVGSKDTFVGGIVGKINHWGDAEIKHPPIISQCFVDDSVYIEAKYAGGLVGGSSATVWFDNCYATCELLASHTSGSGIATAWRSENPSRFTDCYFATLDGDIVMNNNAASVSEFDGVYNDGKKGNCNLVLLNLRFMQGANAKERMPALDYKNIWKIVENGSPVLRCFRNAEAYSCKREPRKTEMSFATYCEAECDPVYGFAGDKIDYSLIPVPERYGYKFLGWYVANNFALLAEGNIINWPANDFIVHANWLPIGYEQGYDENIDPNFDINDGVQHYKPGVNGYNPKNIQAGLKSMHTLPDANVDPTFLINYEFPLEVGKEYDVNFWIKLAAETEGAVDFIHADHPQVNSPTTAGYHPIVDLATVKTGEWVQYKAVITANAPYILVRAPKGSDMYFDSFQIVPTGKDGKLGDLMGFDPSDVSTEPPAIKNNDGNMLWLIVGIAGGVILLAAVATVVVIFVKKGKKA